MNLIQAVCLAAGAGLYAFMVGRYDARHRVRFSRWRILAYAGFLAASAAIMSQRFDGLAHASFAYHMAQHMALWFCAAPLILLAAPFPLLIGALDLGQAVRVVRWMHGPLWRVLTFPLLGWFAFAALLWGSHFSSAYEYALDHPADHAALHTAYFVAALMFWRPVVDSGPSVWFMSHPMRVVYVLAAIPQMSFLGLALYQSDRVLYPFYLQHRLDALADQRAGAELMWIVGGLLMFIVFMLVVRAWAAHEIWLGKCWDERARRTSIGLSVALALSAALPGQARAQADEGRTLYMTRCASCHGVALEGSRIAPPLSDIDRTALDFFLTTGRMPEQDPGVQAERQPPKLTPPEIASLEAYVMARSHGSSALPKIQVSGDLAHGRELFIANCSACHGAAGAGGAVGYGWIAPSLYHATDLQVAEAVRTGPEIMPRFDARTISDTDLDSLVRYVHLLRDDTPNPGGWSLSDTGSVAEGFVAWLVGLGMMLVAVRLIGSDD